MATRDRLVRSAQELLWERGYVGTSPKAIQQRAEAGQGSMYHHFAGKADLALAAIELSAHDRVADAEADFAAAGTAVERIAGYMRREREILRGCQLGRLTQDPDIVTNETLRTPLEDAFARIRDGLARIVADGQAAGELAGNLRSAEVGTTILAVMQGGYVLARAANSTEPFEQAINGALALLDSQGTRPTET